MRISLEAATPIEKPAQTAPAQDASSPFKDVIAATTQAAQVSGPAIGSKPSKSDAGSQQKPDNKPVDKKAAGASNAVPQQSSGGVAVPLATSPIAVVTLPDVAKNDGGPALLQIPGVVTTPGNNVAIDPKGVDPRQEPGSVAGDASAAAPVVPGDATNGQKNNVATALPFDLPISGMQAAPSSDASSALKKSAPAPASTNSGHDAAAARPALPVSTPTETNPPPVAMQANNGMQPPVPAAGAKQNSSPLTKIASGASAKDSGAKQKDAAISGVSDNPSAPAVTVDKSKSDGSGNTSTTSGGEFQRAVKTALSDAANSAPGSSVSAINAVSTNNNGASPATPNTIAQAPTPQNASSASSLDRGSALPTTASAAGAAASTPGLSSAQLVQSMHGSEMRIGMHSDEFGAISINTSLTHQSLAAQISFEHPELGRALSVHVPEMQEKLGNAYGVQTRVEVRDGTATFGGEAGQQSQQNARGQGKAPAEASATATGIGTTGMESVTEAAVSRLPNYSNTRLDIRI